MASSQGAPCALTRAGNGSTKVAMTIKLRLALAALIIVCPLSVAGAAATSGGGATGHSGGGGIGHSGAGSGHAGGTGGGHGGFGPSSGHSAAAASTRSAGASTGHAIASKHAAMTSPVNKNKPPGDGSHHHHLHALRHTPYVEPASPFLGGCIPFRENKDDFWSDCNKPTKSRPDRHG
jgi:hypothetical protein